LFYGWTGKILFIDLTQKAVCLKETHKYQSFIGGRGINQRIVFELIDPCVHPLAPENVIALGAGPFVGTLVPGADRLAVDFKNVMSHGVGSGNCGGQFAAEINPSFRSKESFLATIWASKC
jgi:aldehyde:ferredoxin oxidoreductase